MFVIVTPAWFVLRHAGEIHNNFQPSKPPGHQTCYRAIVEHENI